MSLVVNKKLVFAVVCLGYWLTRLPFINGSYHVLEPDEAHYQILIDQIAARTGWPSYQGEMYLEQFPLFHLLAALVQPLFRPVGVYAGARFIAMLSTFMAGLAIFWHGSNRHSYKLGLVGAIIFWQIPLVMFYSRSGTLDMLAIAFALWAAVLFEAKLDSKRTVVLAGFLWGLAVLTKTATLVYVITFVLIWWTSKYRQLSRLVLLLGGLLAAVVPAFFVLQMLFGSSLIAAMRDMPSRHILPLTNIRVHLAVAQLYIERYVWFFGLTSFVGLITLLVKRMQTMAHLYLPLFFGLGGFAFMAVFDFWPRYPLLITPAIAILSAYGLARLPNKLVIMVVGVGIIIGLYSWQAGNHTALGKVASAVKEYKNQTGLPVYTSFEPYKFSHLSKVDTALLSTQALCGSIVVNDAQQGPVFASFTEPEFRNLKQSINLLSTHSSRLEIVDQLSHFPYSPYGNTYQIYVIERDGSCI